jgi:iron complex outermembrane recepter protein
MKKLLLISIIISSLSVFIQAQQPLSIKGQVIGQDDGQALAFAVVGINSKYTYADVNGNFDLVIAEAPAYELVVEHLGYRPYKVSLLASDLENIQVRLEPEPIVVEQILVEDRPRQTAPQSDLIRDQGHEVGRARDVGDIFEGLPGFGVIKRGGYAMDPVFRSFRQEQLNLVYDGGVQLTHACPNRMDPATTHVTPEEVAKVELIRGPFSVRYGPSMGATLNIITESPEGDSRQGIGGSMEAGYELNGNAKMSRLALNGGQGKYDFYMNAGLKDYGNYQNGAGLEIPSSFRSYDYAVKAGFNPGEKQRLQLSWRQSFGRDILHAALPMDTDEDNTSVMTLDYHIRHISPTLHSLSFKVYGSQVDHVMSNTLRPNFAVSEAVSTVQAKTAGGRAELSGAIGRKAFWYSGLDYRYVGRTGDRVRLVKRNVMTGEELPQPMEFTDEVWQNTSQQNLGAFGEGRFFPSSRWTLAAGLRLDAAFARIDEPAPDFAERYPDLTPDSELNLSATISATYQFDEKWEMQLALGRGVRTADVIERYVNHFQIGLDPFEYVGNPDLRPEANHQAELSATRRGERFSLSGSVFYSYITDYITAAIDSTLRRKYMPMQEPRFAKRFRNVDAAVQAGFELTGEFEIMRRLDLSAGLSFTRAHNLDWDEPLPEIPPLQGVMEVKYRRPVWWAGLRGRVAAAQNRISSSFGEGETPGFAVFDLRAGIQPLKGISIGLAVENLFDRNYYEHLNRPFQNMAQPGLVYEPGRNVSMFVRYELRN